MRPGLARTAMRSGLLIVSILSAVVRSQAPVPPPNIATTPAAPSPNAPSPGSGALCDPRKSNLDALTHRFHSDCGPREWCAPNSVDPSLMTSTPVLPSSASAEDLSASPDDSSEESDSSWDSLPDWQSLRRAIVDDSDGYNQTEDSSLPGPTRLTLPTDVKPSTTSAGLPIATAGVCKLKGCRRDEYPFGYKGVPQDQIPPMCGPGTYCPDEENACQPLIPLGGVCQLNRDDSCSLPGTIPVPTGGNPTSAEVPPISPPPPVLDSAPSQAPASTSASAFSPELPSGLARRILDTLLGRRDAGVGVTFSQVLASGGNSTAFATSSSSGGTQSLVPKTAIGAAKPMCLQGACHLADASQGQACIIDHTQYLGYDSDGKEVIDTVSRDNCRDRLYCDEQTRVCLPEKMQAESCTADRECLEFNCNSKGLCDLPPEAPNRLPPWAFVLIALAILSSLIVTVVALYRVHTAHRSARAEEIDRYFSEQWTFRQSILSMHAAALAATGGIGTVGAAAAALGEASKMNHLLVGSPNGNVFMSPLGAKHLRVLSVDRRDSDDSENTLHSGFMGPGRVSQDHGDGYQHGLEYGHHGGAQASGIRGHVSSSGQDSEANSPFFDGRLSKRKPPPAA
ncbi:hypothetical protein CF319_g572 [Tilletia indica]|nr:hypothetical protein CF319_g572 [Tilletia indica]